MSCVVNENPGIDTAPLEALLEEVIALRTVAGQRAAARLEQFGSCFPDARYTSSAANLAHYLAVRQHELRSLQDRLAEVGLSSLGRGEAHILASLDSIALPPPPCRAGSPVCGAHEQIPLLRSVFISRLDSHSKGR